MLANAKTNALMLGDFLAPARWWRCAACSAIALQARKVPAPFCGPFCAPPVGILRRHPSADKFIDVPHSLTPVLGQVDLLGR